MDQEDRGLVWGLWSAWYSLWCWGLAMLLAPAWALGAAIQRRRLADLFRDEEAAGEAAYCHLRRLREQIETAESQRRFMDLGSNDAVAADDAALRAFLRRLAAIEDGVVEHPSIFDPLPNPGAADYQAKTIADTCHASLRLS